jgi:hypothetical protein
MVALGGGVATGALELAVAGDGAFVADWLAVGSPVPAVVA